MEGYCSTVQSPQRAVVPVEEEEHYPDRFCFSFRGTDLPHGEYCMSLPHEQINTHSQDVGESFRKKPIWSTKQNTTAQHPNLHARKR
jgi:hypothetical protein